jgi:hypothetical protein
VQAAFTAVLDARTGDVDPARAARLVDALERSPAAPYAPVLRGSLGASNLVDAIAPSGAAAPRAVSSEVTIGAVPAVVRVRELVRVDATAFVPPGASGAGELRVWVIAPDGARTLLGADADTIEPGDLSITHGCVFPMGFKRAGVHRLEAELTLPDGAVVRSRATLVVR